MKYTEISIDSAVLLKSKISFLILSATEIETHHIHIKMKPVNGYDQIIKTQTGAQTYYLGIFGEYNIVHVQCSAMGSMGALLTATEALNFWNSKVVIMIGIAFGTDIATQNIGDVLLSESVIPYNLKKVGNKDIVYRSSHPSAGKILVNRFKEEIKNWNYNIDSKKVAVIPTAILSGDDLIDNEEYRNQLLAQFPNAKGGEMEGAGLYNAALNKNIEWILIKSICDFADGNKTINKKANQSVAAKAATDFSLLVMSSTFAFLDLGCLAISNETAPLNNPNDVLFDFYTIEKEKYYVERLADKKISETFNYYSIWVSGVTGCGKTTSILRNLLVSNKKFKYINLAGCINSTLLEIFQQIYFELIEKFAVNMPISRSENLTEIIKKISVLLLSIINENEEIVIYIEEIPVSKEESLEKFVQNIFALIITVNNPKVRFILSSLASPKEYISEFQNKIHEKIKFIRQDAWNDTESLELIELISNKLELRFTTEQIRNIIGAANGSPRFIKRVIRDHIICSKSLDYSLDNLLQETKMELR